MGSQIEAGTYEAPGPGPEEFICYWSRLSGFNYPLTDDIIDSGKPEARTVLEIAPTDLGFWSDNCGVWKKIN